VDFNPYLPQVHRGYRVLMGCTAMLEGQLVINPGALWQDKPQTNLFTPKGAEDQPHEDR